MPQSPIATESFAKLPNGKTAPLNMDATGNQLTASGLNSSLNITAATVVKAAPGRLVRVNVLTAGAAGTASDCATTGAVAAANLIYNIPATVGIYYLDWPCAVGIVITPGASQVLSVSFI